MAPKKQGRHLLVPRRTFFSQFQRAGAGTPGAIRKIKKHHDVHYIHLDHMTPRNQKSVQPFSQKMVSNPFWPLMNIVLLAKIARAPHSIFMAHIWV